MLKKMFKWLLLGVFLFGFIAFFYMGWHQYFSFDWLQKHHQELKHSITDNYLNSILIAFFLYIIMTAFSVPGATFLTVTIGYLFGLTVGLPLVVFGASIGAVIIFLIVQTTLGKVIAKKATGWINKLKTGFSENSFNYLLFLRLVPLFPFWVLNIVPALLGMRLIPFFLATLLGIIPGAAVYLSVGNGLGKVLANEQKPDLGIIFEPHVLWPIIGIAILALLPVVAKKLRLGRKIAKKS